MALFDNYHLVIDLLLVDAPAVSWPAHNFDALLRSSMQILLISFGAAWVLFGATIMLYGIDD
jgi:hypothetical protein